MYVNMIKNTFLGKYLCTQEIKEALLRKKFKIKSIKKDCIIHNEGELCTCLELLLTGKILAIHTDQFGNYLTVDNFTPNDIINGNIIFADSPLYPLSFIAQTKVSILMIDKVFLSELLIKKPDLCKKYLSMICTRAVSLIKNLKLYTKKTIREHLLEYLNSQCTIQNSRIIILSITKKELADRFSVQRSSVSREFARMEKDGLIKINKEKNTIELL